MSTENKARLVLLKDDFEVLNNYIKDTNNNLNAEQQMDTLKKMSEAEIISSENFPFDMSRLTSTVVIRDNVAKINLEYQLVHPNETDERNGKLSPLNPFGIALMGVKKGDSLAWQHAKKKKYYCVQEVRNSTYI